MPLGLGGFTHKCSSLKAANDSNEIHTIASKNRFTNEHRYHSTKNKSFFHTKSKFITMTVSMQNPLYIKLIRSANREIPKLIRMEKQSSDEGTTTNMSYESECIHIKSVKLLKHNAVLLQI